MLGMGLLVPDFSIPDSHAIWTFMGEAVAVSITRCTGNLKLHAGGAVDPLRCGQVDLIQRNLFVVLRIKIGEDLCGHHVILHLHWSATALKNHRERLLG
jgi:hypothetical protein